MRFISWTNAGKLLLEQGSHTVRFKFHSENNNHGGLDCFVFTLRPFMPRGALQPGARTGRANPGFFAWEPDVDAFRDDAVLDLRYLNEDIAGQDGAVKARGNDFVLGSGKKVKFWEANVGPGITELEVLNEGGHFFWTFGKKNMPTHRWDQFTTMFGTMGRGENRSGREPTMERPRPKQFHRLRRKWISHRPTRRGAENWQNTHGSDR